MKRIFSVVIAAFGLLTLAACGPDGACGGGCGDGMTCDLASGSCVADPALAPVDPATAGDGLSCEVQAILVTHCSECHSATPAGGASNTLIARADLIAQSPLYPGQTVAQRSLTRMQTPASPMPPAYKTQVTATELAAFEAWVNGGTPPQSCATSTEPPDAGPPTPTCTSNSFWTFGTAGSSNMEPGLACRNCHRTQQPSRMYPAMGTVFPALHDKDACNARPPSGVRIEILDSVGVVKATMTPKATSGNFYTATALPQPYTARVVMGAKVVTMTTPQTNGDCNVCHTVMGAQGAPGRIVWPQ